MSGSAIPVLFVTFHFPPDVEVGGKRAAFFCKHLPHFGVRPIVLTVKEQLYPKTDASFPLPPSLQVERTDLHRTPADWYMGAKRRLIASRREGQRQDQPTVGPKVGSNQREATSLRRSLLALLDIPDSYWGWYWPAVRAGARLVRRHRPHAIVSTAPPYTSHLIAGHLAKKFGIAWIADYRDLWLDLDVWGWSRRVPVWRDRLDHWLERAWIHRASLVTSTTDASAEVLASRYPDEPAAKFVTLTNGFDDGAPPTVSQRATPGSQLVLHSGTLYGGRTVDTLCLAIAELVRSKRVDPKDFKLLFLGNNKPSIEAAARARTPELFENGCIEFRPPVPWAEAQRIAQEASALLVVQGDHPIAIPAKFYEYLQVGKPIFALVREGALSRMMESTRVGFWAEPEDVSRIAEGLYATLRMPDRSAADAAAISERFHYRVLTARLAEHIHRVTQARA